MKKILIQIISFLALLAIICGIIWLGLYLNKVAHYTRIKAEFTELEPFERNMPVFFKGFQIGKVTDIEPNDDYSATQITITLFPKKLNFPKNIYVQVKSNKGEYDYVEIELPELASEKILQNGDVIKGKSSISFEKLMQMHAENGNIDVIIENLGDVLNSVNSTVQEAGNVLIEVKKILKANEKNIAATTKNLSQTTQNLSNTTSKIDNSIDQQSLNNTMDNIEQATNNIQQITKNIDSATQNLTDTMNQVNQITKNINGITNSVNCTMKKRFGGFRLIFGKADQSCSNCSKN